ncbi:MAG: hypothetical protein ABI593_01025 [Betaproteobacteria bacterium]
MRVHQVVVGWLHVVAGLFAAIGVAVIWVAAAQLAPLFDGTFIPGLLALFGRSVAIALLVITGVEIIAGIALLRGQSWSRVPLVCIGLVQLVAFPFGTALGLYTFWVLLLGWPATPEGTGVAKAG